MEAYLKNISPIGMCRARRKQYNDMATTAVISQFRKLSGAIMLLGKATLLQTSLGGSIMQQKIGKLKVGSMIEIYKSLKELKYLHTNIKF